MDKLKPWQNQLLSLIGQGVRKHGFQSRPKGQSFFKEFELGRVIFHLSFIKHRDDFDVTTDIGIRFNDLEELVNRGNNLISKSEKSMTCSLGCNLGNFSEGRQNRWMVSSVNDVTVVSNSIISAFVDEGLPYIEKFTDAGHVLEILSGDGPDSWLHSPLHGARAIRAVGLALLMQGSEAAQRLAKSKRSFLEDRKDFGLTAFRAFLDKNGLG